MLKVESDKKMSVFQNHEAKWSKNFSISQDNIKNFRPMRDNQVSSYYQSQSAQFDFKSLEHKLKSSKNINGRNDVISMPYQDLQVA